MSVVIGVQLGQYAAREQLLHPEENSFTYFPLPRPIVIVASMWAVTDLCADNGATLLVSCSHKWPADKKATSNEILNAEGIMYVT